MEREYESTKNLCGRQRTILCIVAPAIAAGMVSTAQINHVSGAVEPACKNFQNS